MVEDRYFVIERPGEKGRIKLGPEAKYWAEQNGMTVLRWRDTCSRKILATNTARKRTMVLKYSDRPQLRYGDQSISDSWRSRFPADALPISQAPSQVIFAIEANGQGHLAHYRGGAYRKLTWQRDHKTRAASLREDGSTVPNPVMFTMP